MEPWASAFLTALGLTVVAIPLVRRLAVATDFVDRPAQRKSHTRPIPYLGGVALIVAVLLAILVQRHLPAKIGGLALGAALMGTLGLIDDDRNLSPGPRFVAEMLAAAVAVTLGLRIHATGLVGLDVVLTVIWIVGITNAMNLLDNMDGLAGGVGAAVSLSVLWLALAQGQEVTATVAAALAGACLGFLVYNRPPASVFMGDAGSLFLGFVLAVLTVDVSPALGPPSSFAIPVLLLSLAVLDTATVTLARLRRRRPVSQGGKDHLSHRLVAIGLSRGWAVAVLVGVQAVVGALAVLAGLGIVPLALASALAAGCLLALWGCATKGKVYAEPVVGLPRRLKTGLLAVGVGLVIVVGPALVGLLLAVRPAESGAEHLTRALSALRAGRANEVVAELGRARIAFDQGQSRLHAPLVSAGLAIPGVASNLRAARALADAGNELAGHAEQVASLPEASRLDVAASSPPLSEVSRLAPVMAEASAVLHDVQHRLEGLLTEPYLLPAVRDTTTDVLARLRETGQDVERAAMTARLLPALLGHEGQRRYLLTFHDGEGSLSTGGSVTAWALAVAQQGVVQLEDFGSRPRSGGPDDGWGSAASPDFPTFAQQILAFYENRSGRRLDGLVSMDAPALVRLAQLAGGQGQATDKEDKEGVSREGVSREGVTPAEAHALWQGMARAELGPAGSFAGAVGEAARRGHLFVAFRDSGEQQLAARLGVDGALPPATTDSLLVVTQTSSDRPDTRIGRRVRYAVRIEPGRETAALAGRLELALTGSGEPEAGVPAHVSVVGPTVLREAAVDGAATPALPTRTLDRWMGTVEVTIPPEGERLVRMELAGRVRLDEDGWYRLELVRQPASADDQFEVSVEVPDGWEIAEARGLEIIAPQLARGSLPVGREHNVEIRLVRAGWSGLWHRLFQGLLSSTD